MIGAPWSQSGALGEIDVATTSVWADSFDFFFTPPTLYAVLPISALGRVQTSSKPVLLEGIADGAPGTFLETTDPTKATALYVTVEAADSIASLSLQVGDALSQKIWTEGPELRARIPATADGQVQLAGRDGLFVGIQRGTQSGMPIDTFQSAAIQCGQASPPYYTAGLEFSASSPSGEPLLGLTSENLAWTADLTGGGSGDLDIQPTAFTDLGAGRYQIEGPVNPMPSPEVPPMKISIINGSDSINGVLSLPGHDGVTQWPAVR